MKRSKRYQKAMTQVERTRTYPVPEAVERLKSMPPAKFDETVGLSLKLGVDPKQSDQLLRGSFSLPKGIGKKLRVVVFAQGEKAEKAKAAGAIEVGGQDLVQKIEGGFLDFDVAIAAPDMMRFVGRLGRVLGPKGLMPSPKSGTVTDDVERAVREFSAGKIEYRTDNTGNVHVPVGKRSFPVPDLVENITAFLDFIKASRPSAAKGKFIENVVLSSTMSPGLKLEVS
ncbi:MAG: 50S ribosomal protein L1 [Planctomycetes bacterium]|nr:50S ribosomal protein L1 [Planctomycetota bacterium]